MSVPDRQLEQSLNVGIIVLIELSGEAISLPPVKYNKFFSIYSHWFSCPSPAA
jgi:hypothetical protein